jgi:hypothetical protein
MAISIEQTFQELFNWCRGHGFAGHDPFDALNSRMFQRTPLVRSRGARLLWTQTFKRLPFNLRPLALVPRQQNAKGLALFSLAAISNYRRLQTHEAENEARYLLDQLAKARIEGYSGAAWGYNFDWQSRNFFAPKGTPMVVPTAFAARAFVEATKTFAGADYLTLAQSSCDFILGDLRRTTEAPDEICFSYSPFDNTRIFNASLLAAETLAGVGSITGETQLCDFANCAANYVVRRQGNDGSWTYGMGESQVWTDSFHTAYVLMSLRRIELSCAMKSVELRRAVEHGYDFWRERFFLADGWPKYYHDRLYPADAHAAATAIITLIEFSELDDDALSLARKIASWAIAHLRDERGFFYYQRHRFFTIRTPYMRWTQAWMLYALARLLEVDRAKV